MSAGSAGVSFLLLDGLCTEDVLRECIGKMRRSAVDDMTTSKALRSQK